MSAEQGADELRIRATLIKQGVGPDADPAPAVPPAPIDPPDAPDRDWLDDILEGNAAPPPAEPADEPEEGGPAPEPDSPKAPKPTVAVKTKPQAKPRKRKKRKPRRPGPNTPHTPWDSRPQSPRQSLLDAWDRVPYRLKWLAYHASAAYLGWSMGWVDWCTSVTAWLAQADRYDPQAMFLYVAFAATFLLHHATRKRWWPVAWLAAVPACSVVGGVLLYGNGWTDLELSL